jgi:hypothetical protein
MKIRTGFVSNSSSSSFCILGVTSGDIAQQIDVVKFFNSNDEEDFDDDWYERSEELGFDIHSGIDTYYEDYCLGTSIENIDEHVSIIIQKKLLADKLNEKFGTKFEINDIRFMVDGGHD